MRSFVVAIATYLAVSLLACQDTKEGDLDNASSDVASYRKIGRQIPFETGMQWMEYYKKKNSEQGKVGLLGLGLFTYTISGTQMEAMLESVSDLVGVAFHYATDNLGNTHIIAIPIDPSLSVWSSIPGRIFIDTNTGNPISQSTAQAWAQTYKDAHPTGIWFHYFGETIFDQILAIPYLNSIDIEPAINILNLTPQMLLIVWNEDLLPFGRTVGAGKAAAERATIFDASNPCPPCACE
jgi:hypothetical protein